MVLVEHVGPSRFCAVGHLQPQVVVVLKLLLLVPAVQFRGNHLLDARPILAIQHVVLAVPAQVHVVRPHVAPDLGRLVVPLQLLALGVPVVF